MSFVQPQPPFWSTNWARATAPHAISVLVTPAIALGASSVATATVLATLTPHGLVSGDTATIAGHIGSTPAIDGTRVVTVIDALHVSIPVNVTVAGAGGTMTRTIAIEPLTLAEGQLRAGFEWSPGDAREALLRGFIAAARSQVEQDTGLALLTQTRDIYLDAVAGRSLRLPAQSTPLQAVVSLTSIDTAGAAHVLDPATYVVDLASGRIGLALSGAWPSDLRPFQPYVLRIVSGYATVALIPPLLLHAVGLLTAHYATLGRDLANVDPAALVPYGYADAIAPYRLVAVA